MAYIAGDKLVDCNYKEIPCRTREDIDAIILDNKYTELPAYFIAKMGDTELLKYILEKTSDLNIRTDHDVMIYYAAIGGQKDTIEYLYQRALMTEYHIKWDWAIWGAAKGGHLDLVKEYEQRAIINEENINWVVVLIPTRDFQIIKYICEKILIGGGILPLGLLSVFECSDNEGLKEYLNSLGIE